MHVIGSRLVLPNKALHATYLSPLRYGKSAPELLRWAS